MHIFALDWRRIQIFARVIKHNKFTVYLFIDICINHAIDAPIDARMIKLCECARRSIENWIVNGGSFLNSIND